MFSSLFLIWLIIKWFCYKAAYCFWGDVKWLTLTLLWCMSPQQALECYREMEAEHEQ